MTTLIQVCTNFVEPENLSYILVRMRPCACMPHLSSEWDSNHQPHQVNYTYLFLNWHLPCRENAQQVLCRKFPGFGSGPNSSRLVSGGRSRMFRNLGEWDGSQVVVDHPLLSQLLERCALQRRLDSRVSRLRFLCLEALARPLRAGLGHVLDAVLASGSGLRLGQPPDPPRVNLRRRRFVAVRGRFAVGRHHLLRGRGAEDNRFDIMLLRLEMHAGRHEGRKAERPISRTSGMYEDTTAGRQLGVQEGREAGRQGMQEGWKASTRTGKRKPQVNPLICAPMGR